MTQKRKNDSKFTIIILHGWNLEADRFSPLVSELEKNQYKVYCPDLPGFGNSELPDKALYLDDYIKFVEKYIDRYQLHDLIIIGHSFGGRIAIKMAAGNSKLKALIVSGTPGINPVPKLKVNFYFLLAKIGEIIFSLPGFNLFKGYAKYLLYRMAKATDFYTTGEKMKQTFKNIIKEDLRGYMRKISIPVLLLWGFDDTIIPFAIAEKMKKIIPDAQIKVIKQARHGVCWTHPKEFAQAVDKFIKNLISK